MLEDFLRPVALLFANEDPSLYVLGFHYKHAITGNDDVVDLSGALFRGQGDILDEVVEGFIEKEFYGKISDRFPSFALEPKRFEYSREDQQRDQVPEGVEGGL